MAPDLAAWIEICRGAGIDDEIVGSMWGGSSITPPPVAHPPITRYALTRARELVAASGECEAAPARARRLHSEAVEWLGHPHPRCSSEIRREMGRLKAELEAAADRGDPGAQD